MTGRALIPTATNRVTQPHRSSPLVQSELESHTKGTTRLLPGLNPGQTLSRNMEAVDIAPHTNVSVAVTDPADNALSP